MERICWVGLGSNLEEPYAQVQRAIHRLSQDQNWQVSGVSSLYETAPMGPIQPNYVNAVLRMICAMPAVEILERLFFVEKEQGRIRNGDHWGPRVLDLDLLLCGEEVIQTPELQLPHPGLLDRAFVLYPMKDVDPDFVLPNGKTVTEQLLFIGDKNEYRCLSRHI